MQYRRINPFRLSAVRHKRMLFPAPKRIVKCSALQLSPPISICYRCFSGDNSNVSVTQAQATTSADQSVTGSSSNSNDADARSVAETPEEVRYAVQKEMLDSEMRNRLMLTRGQHDASTLTILWQYAKLHETHGRRAAAIKNLKTILEAGTEVLGERHEFVVTATIKLARLLLRKSVAALKKAHVAGQPVETAEPKGNVDEESDPLVAVIEARRLLEGVIDFLPVLFGPHHLSTIQAHGLLADILGVLSNYDYDGDLEKQEQERKEAAQLQQSITQSQTSSRRHVPGDSSHHDLTTTICTENISVVSSDIAPKTIGVPSPNVKTATDITDDNPTMIRRGLDYRPSLKSRQRGLLTTAIQLIESSMHCSDNSQITNTGNPANVANKKKNTLKPDYSMSKNQQEGDTCNENIEEYAIGLTVFVLKLADTYGDVGDYDKKYYTLKSRQQRVTELLGGEDSDEGESISEPRQHRPVHPLLLEFLCALATSCSLCSGRRQEEREIYESVIPALIQHAPSDINTLIAQRNYANALGALGELDEASDRLTDCLVTLEQTLGIGHPETCLTLHCLAERHKRAGRREEAVAGLEELLRRMQEVIGLQSTHSSILGVQREIDALKSIPPS